MIGEYNITDYNKYGFNIVRICLNSTKCLPAI